MPTTPSQWKAIASPPRSSRRFATEHGIRTLTRKIALPAMPWQRAGISRLTIKSRKISYASSRARTQAQCFAKRCPGGIRRYSAQAYRRGFSKCPIVRACMPVLFELLEAESAPQARAVLGHFFFVYIHPYMDGNGRLARFLMNLMLVPTGYVWTVIPVERRKEYTNALEQASSFANIAPFAAFVADMAKAQAKEPLPRPR